MTLTIVAACRVMTLKTSPNVLLVSHCDLLGNSAYHALGLARMFQLQGFCPAIAIPDNLASIEVVGKQEFVITTYAGALAGEQLFDRRGTPDLIHAFTPRELVRRFTEEVSARFGCPYIVHLEDNERVIVEDELGKETLAALLELPPSLTDSGISEWRSHPQRAEKLCRACQRDYSCHRSAARRSARRCASGRFLARVR